MNKPTRSGVQRHSIPSAYGSMSPLQRPGRPSSSRPRAAVFRSAEVANSAKRVRSSEPHPNTPVDPCAFQPTASSFRDVRSGMSAQERPQLGQSASLDL